MVPVPTEAIPDAFTKHIDPAGAAAMRMMAARAMAPIPPKVLVPIVYQLLMDADSKIAAAAQKTFTKLDDKLLLPVAGEALPGQVLDCLLYTSRCV